jgi:hypothetical protein
MKVPEQPFLLGPRADLNPVGFGTFASNPPCRLYSFTVLSALIYS